MEYKYRCCFSFAGEDREYVEEVASILKDQGVKIFYDKFEEVELWGKDLGIHFEYVYNQVPTIVFHLCPNHIRKRCGQNMKFVMQFQELLVPMKNIFCLSNWRM